MITLYLAGPVTGRPKLNKPLFVHHAIALRDKGYEVIIPHDHVPSTATHDEAMSICLPIVEKVDGLALIPGWELSVGARMEYEKAFVLGIPAKRVEEWR